MVLQRDAAPGAEVLAEAVSAAVAVADGPAAEGDFQVEEAAVGGDLNDKLDVRWNVGLGTRRAARVAAALLGAAALAGCGLQSIPQARNQVEAAQAEITNQYQRRADLIPNLVAAVKGAASHERETLEAVVAARARATQTQLNISDAKAMQEFQQAQGALSQALGRLLAVAENYPQLKANENFRELQVQLEGTENRITIARQRFIEAIQHHNNLVTVFPTSLTNSLVHHYDKLPQFGADKDVKSLETAPKVDFGGGQGGR